VWHKTNIINKRALLQIAIHVIFLYRYDFLGKQHVAKLQKAFKSRNLKGHNIGIICLVQQHNYLKSKGFTTCKTL
jgi:hypothetical protein